MSEAEAAAAILDAARFGMFMGAGLGVVIVFVIREFVHDIKHWWRSLDNARQIRSMRDWK